MDFYWINRADRPVDVVEKTVDVVLVNLSYKLRELQDQVTVLHLKNTSPPQSTDGHAAVPAVPAVSSVPVTPVSPHVFTTIVPSRGKSARVGSNPRIPVKASIVLWSSYCKTPLGSSLCPETT